MTPEDEGTNSSPHASAEAPDPRQGPAAASPEALDCRDDLGGSPAVAQEHLEELRCAYHPGRPTMVRCSECGRPLCPDCMVFAAVGIKCRECARVPRSARVTLTTDRWAKAIGAGLGAGTAVGFAYYYLLGSVGFFLVVFFVAAGIGYLVGEAVVRASGHYRGRETAAIAVVSTLWAFILPPLLASLIRFGASWNVVVFSVSSRGIINWVIMAIAAYLAYSRNR